MSNIGFWEIVLVVVLALIVFGPKKLPELGSALGRSIRGFKKGLQESREEIQATVAQVKEATGVDEIKATVAEVREAVDVKKMVSASAGGAAADSSAGVSPGEGEETRGGGES